jgi:hypothetical protein
MMDGRPRHRVDALAVIISQHHGRTAQDPALDCADADPSKDVTVIVDEDAVDERPAGWLVGCDVPC